MNSRFASMRWPERAATALAMEMDCASATMVSAKARLSRSSARQSTLGTWNGGQGWAMAPSTAPAPPHAFQAAAAIVPARPASI